MSLIIPGTVLASNNPGVPQLSDRTASDLDFGASPSASVTWQFLLNGQLQKIEGGSTTTFGFEWWSAGSTANIGQSYDVRCKEILSGPAFTTEAAAVGTYIQMSATRAWVLTKTTQPGDSTVATFQLVATGTTTPILAEADLTFTAEVETGA